MVARRSLAGAGSGFEEGRRISPVDIVDGSPRKVRESLTSYLFPFSQYTPPASFNSSNPSVSVHPLSLPLTPDSTNTYLHQPPLAQSQQSKSSFSSIPIPEYNLPLIPLISSVFPFHTSIIASQSHILEILTLPNHILQAFILDHTSGRTVYVHLPPTHPSVRQSNHLSANFSQILRPHDPEVSQQHSQPDSGALDVRESLTALLDLADTLKAKQLVLVLDKDDREPERLGELLHALMYVGGVMVRPGALEGGWEWDQRQWVLVGMEV